MNRFATLSETITSEVPGTNIRPSVSVICGRSAIPFSSTPRIVTFEQPPSRLSRLRTTTSSAEASGFPSASFSMPGSVRRAGTWSRPIPDWSSDCEFWRRTRTFLSEPEAVKTFVSPSPSAMTQRKTATTRAMPRTVSVVVTFLTKRFRTLYFSGMPSIVRCPPSSADLPEAVGDGALGGADGRDEPGDEADEERDRRCRSARISGKSCIPAAKPPIGEFEEPLLEAREERGGRGRGRRGPRDARGGGSRRG